jgi:hypothetical protein
MRGGKEAVRIGVLMAFLEIDRKWIAVFVEVT